MAPEGLGIDGDDGVAIPVVTEPIKTRVSRNPSFQATILEV
jgi:hypothetical protein